MYEKFLDKSLNSTRQMADAAFIAQYANVVSEKIIELTEYIQVCSLFIQCLVLTFYRISPYSRNLLMM